MKSKFAFILSSQDAKEFGRKIAVSSRRGFLHILSASLSPDENIELRNAFYEGFGCSVPTIGATTGGNFMGGVIDDAGEEGSVFTFTEFSKETTVAKTFFFKDAEAFDTAKFEGASATILFSDGYNQWIEGSLVDIPAGPFIAGGKAGDYQVFDGKSTLIMTENGVWNEGAVGLSIFGAVASADYSFDWIPVGKKLIAGTDSGKLVTLDGLPAKDVLKRYLGEDIATNIAANAIEFPLMVERNGKTVARAIMEESDGKYTLTGPITDREYVRIGIGEKMSVLKSARRASASFSGKPADVAFAYSCTGRRQLLGVDISEEISAIEEICPKSCGFFTYSEFFGNGTGGASMLNFSTVTLTLSEGDRIAGNIKEKTTRIAGDRTSSVMANMISEMNKEFEAKSVEMEETKMADFQKIIAEVPVAIWMGDKNEETVYANKLFCEICEYSLEEMIGKKSYMFWTEESLNTVKNNNKLRKKGEISTYDGELLSKTGKVIPVRLTGVPVSNAGTVGMMLDLRQLENEKKERQQMEKLINDNHLLGEYRKALSSAAMVMTYGPDGKILSVNDVFCSNSGYSSDELIGKNYYETYKDAPEDAEWTWKDMTKNGRHQSTVLNKRKDGSDFWTENTTLPIRGSQHEVKEVVCVLVDVTNIQKTNENLKVSYEKLKELDSRKDDFLNVASHELRTPITAVKGYASMLHDGDIGELTEKQKQCTGKIISNSERLVRLINDMLDIAKIEAGKYEFTFQDLEIAPIIEDVVSDMRQIAIAKKQTLDYDVSGIAGVQRKADQNKFKQVLINLIGNALKFTPENGIIKVICSMDGADMKIAVIDSGIGISKENFGKVFEKFGQVKNSLTRDVNGTGLGLPIVKSIVEKMGGDITVESELGKGSVFTVILKK